MGNPLNYRDGITLTWKNGRQLASSTVGSIVTTYNYDISGNRVYRAGGGFRHTYHVVDGTALGEKIVFVSNGTTHYMEYMRDENGEVYGFIYDGGTYFLEKNALGDLKYLLNGNGGVLAKYTYDEWGKVISVTDANGNAITDKANVAHLNPFRYRSYYYDDETGFYYLKSRYYDPSLCRFINADSILSTDDVNGYNMFAYCGNNPVNRADPTGRAFMFLTAAIGALAGAVVGGVVAAATGKSVLAGVAIGAAVGGLIGLTCGAAAGVILTGSATASTAAVMSGAGMLATTVSTGGIGAGVGLVIDNISKAVAGSGGQAASSAVETGKKNLLSSHFFTSGTNHCRH